MKLTLNYKIFLGIVLILFLINLFIANDLAVIWDGPEAWRIWQFQKTEVRLSIWRLPGPLFLMLGLFIFWLIAQKIFGAKTSLLTLVVLAASLLVPNLAKQAILDSWLFCFQTIATMGLLMYLKQPKANWQLLFYTALLPCLWLAPLSTLLTFSILAIALYFLHPQGNRLFLPSALPVVVVILAGLYFAGTFNWSTPQFFIAWGQQPFYKNLFHQLLGFLPFLGFVCSGFWELYQKSKKKEEWSIILLCWMLAALAGQSLLLSLGLALMVAKQLEAYFIQNYPYRTIVKTGAILHLLIAFFGICFLMMRGFYEFKGMGFRAALAFGALYWMPAFIAVIGLYGMNRRFVLGGTIFSGVMATLFFWVQLYPLLYTRLNWQEEIVQEILESQDNPTQIWIYKTPDSAFPALACYASRTFPKVEVVEGTDNLENVLELEEYRPLFILREPIEMDSTYGKAIEAWGSFGLAAKKYNILPKNSGK